MNMLRFRKQVFLILSCVLLFQEVTCEGTSEDSEGEDSEDDVSTDAVLSATEISMDIHTLEKMPEAISNAATIIIMEPSSTTENAAISVLEATEGATEKNEQMSSKVFVSTFQTPVISEVKKEKAPEHTFAVWDSKGKICLLAKFHAVFSITYPSKGGDQSVSVEMPPNIISKGKCGYDSKSPVLRLSWNEFGLTVTFSKIPKEEEPDEWAVTGLELRYDMSAPLFDGATNKINPD